MKIFNKIKEILFDEETVEIPVITKEEKKEEPKIKKEETVEQPKRRTTVRDDEVIIHKIETPKREVKSEAEDVFDMPKLKEEAKEEVKRSTFTFPVFEDEEDKPIKEKRETRTTTSRREKQEPPKETQQKKRASGYTNAFDYSYGKYKGDYKASLESSKDVVQETLNKKDEHKVFTPSPIISPVYGVLNENYKKEDIVTKDEHKATSSEALDLDSVRRKAYGTLEDEIEDTLSYRDEDIEIEKKDEFSLEENGISINDLLVDSEDEGVADEDVNEELEIEDVNEEEDDGELFSELVANSENELDFDELAIDDEEEPVEERKPELDTLVETDDLQVDDAKKEKAKTKKEEPVPPNIIIPDEENSKDLKNQKSDGIGEEDLFDLIDSLYEGKGEE